MDIQSVSRLFLLICNTYIIAAAACVLFIFSKKKDYKGMLYLLFLTMIYNTILKDIFKHPLPPTCPSQGFGFPSGHMNFLSVFYLWIAVVNKNILLRIFMLAALSLEGLLIYLAGYHYGIDVVITPIFAITAILIYRYFANDKPNQKIFPIIGAITIIIATVTIFMHSEIQHHIALAYYFIFGFGTALLTKDKLVENIKISVLNKAIIITSILLLEGFGYYFREDGYIPFANGYWFLFGAALPFVRMLLTKTKA